MMRASWFAAAVVAGLALAGVASAAQPLAQRPFRLCVLDQGAVVQSSRLAQEMGVRFQQVRQQAQAKLEDDRRTLDADARALDKLRTSLPAAVAKARDAEIVQRRAQLKAKEDQINRNLTDLDAQLTANVGKVSDPMVRQVEAERGCSMLVGLGAVIHVDDPTLDITAAVIERLNSAAPAAQPAR
jgi:Skp family chaperone for outer membrane proteins